MKQKVNKLDFYWVGDDVFREIIDSFNSEISRFKDSVTESINVTLENQGDLYFQLYEKGVSCQFWFTDEEILMEKKVDFDELFDDFIDFYGDEISTNKAKSLKNQLLKQINKLDKLITKDSK
jgi:hypothetical protein